MFESSTTSVIPPSSFLQPDPDMTVSDFMAHPPDLGQGKQRVVWFRSMQSSGHVEVLVSWEAQCAVARSDDMTTDDIFSKHARAFDQQIAIMLASNEPPSNGVWTLDAGDIAPVI